MRPRIEGWYAEGITPYRRGRLYNTDGAGTD
jgi:hypothetical protein